MQKLAAEKASRLIGRRLNFRQKNIAKSKRLKQERKRNAHKS